MPNPIPAVLLARLAIGRPWRGACLGADLLRDAVLRATTAATVISVRAMSEPARTFYEHHGFRASRIDPRTLMVTI